MNGAAGKPGSGSTIPLKDLEAYIRAAGKRVQMMDPDFYGLKENPKRPAIPFATALKTLSLNADFATRPDNVLALARGAAVQTKSRVTKLSLLIINEPFDPRAVSRLVVELVTGPLEYAKAAALACDPAVYTACFRREFSYRIERMVLNLLSFLQCIPTNGKALTGKDKDAFTSTARGSLPLTGMLWAACDELVTLVDQGVVVFFRWKMAGWKELIDDITNELREWSEKNPDDDSENDDDDDNNNNFSGGGDGAESAAVQATIAAQAAIDSIMNAHHHIPADDPKEIRPRLAAAIRRLRLTSLLLQAITKRRIKNLPPFPIPETYSANPDFPVSAIPSRLDQVAELIYTLPEGFEYLASCFYNMESDEIDMLLDDQFLHAFAASELMRYNWDGSSDELTTWIDKFQLEIKKA